MKKLLLLTFAVLVACESPNDPVVEDFGIKGTWHGSGTDYTIELQVYNDGNSSDDFQIAGSGLIHNQYGTVTFVFFGTVNRTSSFSNAVIEINFVCTLFDGFVFYLDMQKHIQDMEMSGTITTGDYTEMLYLSK